MATKTTTDQGVPRKPLLFADTFFDDDRIDDIELSDARYDAAYVPGYSEAKRENEIRAAQGKPTVPLPRLQWVRVARTNGRMLTESDEGMVNWLKLGYRACGLQDLESHGWGRPPTASVGPDGLIRRGDLALFIVGTERAERNRAAMRRLNASMIDDDEPNSKTGEVMRDRDREHSYKGSLSELAQIELPD